MRAREALTRKRYARWLMRHDPFDIVFGLGRTDHLLDYLRTCGFETVTVSGKTWSPRTGVILKLPRWFTRFTEALKVQASKSNSLLGSCVDAYVAEGILEGVTTNTAEARGSKGDASCEQGM